MDRKKLLVAGGLIGFIILIIGAFVIISPIIGISTYFSNSTDENSSTDFSLEDFAFNNSTPEAMVISIARLNEGKDGFMYFIKANASLTSDGKYWIVSMCNENYPDEGWVVTVDAKTGMSKKNGSINYLGTERPTPMNTWRSLDELKAQYIAEIQCEDIVGKPNKITMDGKEIWKVPIKIHIYENTYSGDIYTGKNRTEYVYVDVATGKSKNTWNDFNKDAGKKGWLTLKEVDNVLTKRYGSFRSALSDLYLE